MSLSPRFVSPVFSVGLASALAALLASASNMAIAKIASGYGDIPVAAYGTVKKTGMFPLGVSIGLCRGFLPLVGYNYAAGNDTWMQDVSAFSWKTTMRISAGFAVCFACFAPGLLRLFIPEAQTSELGARFLRIVCSCR